MPTMVTRVDGNQADPNTGNVPSRPYKSFVGVIDGTSDGEAIAPSVFATFENTLPEPLTFQYISPGIYHIPGNYPVEKTIVYLAKNSAGLCGFAAYPSGDHIVLETTGNTGQHEDGWIYTTPLEIRLYEI